MAKAKKAKVADVTEEPAVVVAPPVAEPDGTVAVVLKDEHERGEHLAFRVAVPDRARVYYHEGASYEAVRQDSDGTWIYRKATI